MEQTLGNVKYPLDFNESMQYIICSKTVSNVKIPFPRVCFLRYNDLTWDLLISGPREHYCSA